MVNMKPSLGALLFLLTGSCGAQATGTMLPVARWSHAASPSTEAFRARWGDGRAEVAAYRGVVSRYGATHDAEVVLIYVTEPLDRATLVKDDDAPADRRLDVLKLNFALRFQTGIYPYSVLTSVFAPVNDFGAERFSPAKISFGEQDWCGGVFSSVWPDDDAFIERSHSYFASEGDQDVRRPVAEGTLYEDALYIQLRELDGPFAGGAAWEGDIVPSLWRARRDHTPLSSVHARITRTSRSDREVFVLQTDGAYERTFEVGHDADHPLLAFQSSDGDSFQLAGRDRLAYWELHDPGEESFRAQLGLSRGLDIAPSSPASGTPAPDSNDAALTPSTATP